MLSGSGMTPKLSVNRPLRENEASFDDSAHIMGECSLVALEQNRVQDALASLHVHSLSWRMQSTVDFEMN